MIEITGLKWWPLKALIANAQEYRRRAARAPLIEPWR